MTLLVSGADTRKRDSGWGSKACAQEGRVKLFTRGKASISDSCAKIEQHPHFFLPRKCVDGKCREICMFYSATSQELKRVNCMTARVPSAVTLELAKPRARLSARATAPECGTCVCVSVHMCERVRCPCARVCCPHTPTHSTCMGAFGWR